MEQAPSAGKTGAITSGATGSLIVCFMWLCRHFGIADMDESTATAFVTIAVMMACGVMHVTQRANEKKAGEPQ